MLAVRRRKMGEGHTKRESLSKETSCKSYFVTGKPLLESSVSCSPQDIIRLFPEKELAKRKGECLMKTVEKKATVRKKAKEKDLQKARAAFQVGAMAPKKRMFQRPEIWLRKLS